MDDLKDYDDKLIYIIIFNVALTILINNPTTFVENNEIISIVLTVPILYLPVYLLKNGIPRNWKFILLYPNNKCHRFAHGIFTRLKNNNLNYNENLIDVDLIINNHGMPKSESEEDNLWYQIYYKYRYDKKIYQQNRRFLFSRDLTMIILILTIVFAIIAIVFGLKSIIPTIIILGFIEFIIFWNLAREYNKTLALYVLQEETEFLKKKIMKQ